MAGRAIPLVVALLLVATVQAGLLLRTDLLARPAAMRPVSLAAGPSGSTSLGASATSATTTASIVALPIDVLVAQRSAGAWTVRLEEQSASGFGSLESLTLSLVGATTQVQVQVVLGALTQLTGTPVALDGATSLVTVRASGTAAVTGSVTVHFVFVPQGGAQPEFRYAYTLTLA